MPPAWRRSADDEDASHHFGARRPDLRPALRRAGYGPAPLAGGEFHGRRVGMDDPRRRAGAGRADPDLARAALTPCSVIPAQAGSYLSSFFFAPPASPREPDIWRAEPRRTRRKGKRQRDSSFRWNDELLHLWA